MEESTAVSLAILETPEDGQCWSNHVVPIHKRSGKEFNILKLCVRRTITNKNKWQCATEYWNIILFSNNINSRTGSLWRPQSQQSFNTLTRFFFPFSLTTIRYTIIQLDIFNGLFLLQRIRWTYAIWCRDVTCCASVLQLCIPNTCYQ
jgi:hypothetical protein